MAKLPFKDERIIQMNLASIQGHFEIIAPIYMYELGYNFPLQGFMREVFWYYILGLGQLYPNT
jgi:hypothetical protein